MNDNWQPRAKAIKDKHRALVEYGLALLNMPRDTEGVPIYWDILYSKNNGQSAFDEGVKVGATYIGNKSRKVFDQAAQKANRRLMKAEVQVDYAEQQQAAERMERKKAQREANPIKVWKHNSQDPTYYDSLESAKADFYTEFRADPPKKNPTIGDWTKWGSDGAYLVKRRYGKARNKENYLKRKSQKAPTMEVSSQKSYSSTLDKIRKK
jgi:hypothetical protein